ncbi:hypothetical protein [Flexivirga caeni]|uniref:HutD family protein n=1 Tax=Flexivirga caeni TaxID=2294115 RepID=A0A3M9MIX0_9MICO|nr:hypothetical protein [Flexivirga caeni]RNI25481.1 hypothetical protein EFY87_02380 [Flexivirga caeni]
MRLLLRQAVHRAVVDGIEIAASPDTPDREPWLWQVRVLDRILDGEPVPADRSRDRIGLPCRGSSAVLDVLAHGKSITTTTELLTVHEPMKVTRDTEEIAVLIVGRQSVLVEGRHRLHELDALVLEGDDPISFEIAPGEDETHEVPVGLVRLRSTTTKPISWVP